MIGSWPRCVRGSKSALGCRGQGLPHSVQLGQCLADLLVDHLAVVLDYPLSISVIGVANALLDLCQARNTFHIACHGGGDFVATILVPQLMADWLI